MVWIALQRLERRQRVAADVSDHARLDGAQRHVGAHVRAARTQHRRAHERFGLGRLALDAPQCRGLRQNAGLDQSRAYDLGRELADAREVPLAVGPDAQRPHRGLDERLQLLDHQDPLDRRAEAAHQVFRQGVGDTQLQYAGAGGDLLHVGVGRSERDHAEVRALPLPADQLRGLEPGRELRLALDDERMAQARMDREHHVLGGILEEAAGGVLLALPGAYQAARVRQAGRAAHDHGSVEALAQLEGETREVERLLCVGGLQHRNRRELGEQTRVLLVL